MPSKLVTMATSLLVTAAAIFANKNTHLHSAHSAAEGSIFLLCQDSMVEQTQEMGMATEQVPVLPQLPPVMHRQDELGLVRSLLWHLARRLGVRG